MAWKTSITAEGTIVQSKKYLTNTLFTVVGAGQKFTQSRVITVTRYPGLTQTAAEAAALTFSSEANVTDAHTEYTGGGSYAVQKTEDVFGDWELDEGA